MATRNIVPRATGEGQIGTSAKTWSAGYFNDIAVTNGVSASTFSGDLTGDVTGDVTGTASGNLPLTGGVVTGEVGIKGMLIGNPNSLDSTPGKYPGLYEDIENPKRHSAITFNEESANGGVVITARDENNTKYLNASSDGTLRWNGKEIERVNASGSDYIRYDNGLQICWGHTANKTVNGNSNTSQIVTFPVAFKNSDYSVSVTSRFVSGSWTNNTTVINNNTTTSVELFLDNVTGSAYTFYFVWMAIGLWK